MEKSLHEKILELTQLPVGWDGYNAPQVGKEVAEVAKCLWLSTLEIIPTPPQVVPGNGGGCQMEWHCNDVVIEVHIVNKENIEVEVYVKNPYKIVVTLSICRENPHHGLSQIISGLMSYSLQANF